MRQATIAVNVVIALVAQISSGSFKNKNKFILLPLSLWAEFVVEVCAQTRTVNHVVFYHLSTKMIIPCSQFYKTYFK